jgi:hypothetical protein
VSLPVVLVLVLAVLATLGALGWTVRVLVGRLRTLGGDLDRLQRDLVPALEDLQRDADVTRAELDGLGDRLEDWSDVRARRPRRRWRPPPR